ncbi:MAG: methyltransferase domain-containing protein [Armatimonadetes bacterium]|nr:methyltransferase domain-containing protein [Armatimonadota bacterium]
MARPDLPDPEPSLRLAEWLAGPRGRLLRRAQIGQRRRVLEVGCGHGFVTEELVRRVPGQVVALDRDIRPAASRGVPGAQLVRADAAALPFGDASFGLVLFQNTLLWVSDPRVAIEEATRVLLPRGCLLAIEPDFGGMIEYPPEIALQDVWLRALAACGADPLIGRKLPGMCERTGLEVWTELQGFPQPVGETTTGLLRGLPLTDHDETRVCRAEERLASRSGTWEPFVHVPYFLIAATKR